MKRAALLILAIGWTATAAWADVVPADLAQGVAQDAVARTFADCPWNSLGHVTAVNADDLPAGYVFVFGADGSAWQDLATVRAALAAGAEANDGESELSLDTAVVVTGANDTDDLVLRKMRGLPAWLVAFLGAPDGSSLVMMGADDFRVVEKASAQARGIRSPAWAALKSERVGHAEREEARKSEWSAEWKAAEAEAEAEADAARKGAWAARGAAQQNGGVE